MTMSITIDLSIASFPAAFFSAAAITQGNDMTNDLLKLVVEAHGGLARWNAIRTLEADMSITGGIWHVKQKPDIFRHVVAAIDTQAQRVELRPFTAPDRRSIFTPG